VPGANVFNVFLLEGGFRIFRKKGFLVIGYWLVVDGFWLLADGCWLLLCQVRIFYNLKASESSVAFLVSF
jgi:hypothetical protein